MLRDPSRPPPAPPTPHPHDEPLPPRPRPGAWPPGAPLPLADRQHQPRRLALALTRASGLALAVAATAALLLVAPMGTRRHAEAHVERELASALEPGERILAQTSVEQRRSADLWRRSYGLLVVTSRRVVYVGATPRPVMHPVDPGPRDLLYRSWPYDRDIVLVAAPNDADGTLTVRSAGRTTRFHTDDADGALAVRRAVTEIRRQRSGEPAEAASPY